MKNYATLSLTEARREYLATCTTAMPIAGFIAWTALAVALFFARDSMPYWAPFIAAAIPAPLAFLIDKLRGTSEIWRDGMDNPVSQLFMRFIWVVALLTPFIIIAVQASGDADLLVLGMAILAGMIWVPHGWGADDPAGFTHFVLRALLCYAAYLLAPEAIRGAMIAAGAAATYVYAIIAMKKPASARASI